MSVRPGRIRVSRSQGRLFIEWNDGHRSEYSLAALRAACPCAECQAREEARSRPSEEGLEIALVSTAATQLASLEQVGNYALQLTWQDGHRYGIYTWAYLRSLCPCGEHAEKGKKKEGAGV